MDLSLLRNGILLSWIVITQARHWCVRYNPDPEVEPEKIWCDTGCCGHGNETHCCHVKSEFEIVEGVLGALGGFFIILTVVVTFFCCRSHHRKLKRNQMMTEAAINARAMAEVKVTHPSTVK